MNTKYIHCIHLHSPFPYAHPPSTDSNPQKTYFTLLPFIFFKFILMAQGSFALVLQACIYHALIKLCYLLFITIPTLKF
jgi:hypothetical protein